MYVFVYKINIPTNLSCFILSMKTDNKTNQVMKDFKRQEAVYKGREKYRNNLQGSILNELKISVQYTSNSSNDTIYVTISATASATNDYYL